MRRLLPVVVLVASSLTLVACTNHVKKVEEKQKSRDQQKQDLVDKDEAKRKAALAKIEPAHLEPFWDDGAFLKVGSGKPCPEGVWSMFSTAPGEDAEKAANEAKRGEYLPKVKGATYVTTLNVDTGVKVLAYNTKKKVLPVEIDGLVECTDGVGMVSMAWGTPAKVLRPKGEQLEELTPQSVWRAKPVVFSLPFETKEEASSFVEGPGAGLQVRLVYRVQKTQEDKHLVKTEQGKVDYGAGRLVHVELVGARLATDHEKVAVVEKKYRE